MFPIQRIELREALKLLDSCSKKSGFTTILRQMPLRQIAGLQTI